MSDREALLRYYRVQRTDIPSGKREEITSRILWASDKTIRTDRPCVGKHWFVMRFGDVCPYCDWRLAAHGDLASANVGRSVSDFATKGEKK